MALQHSTVVVITLTTVHQFSSHNNINYDDDNGNRNDGSDDGTETQTLLCAEIEGRDRIPIISCAHQYEHIYQHGRSQKDELLDRYVNKTNNNSKRQTKTLAKTRSVSSIF